MFAKQLNLYAKALLLWSLEFLFPKITPALKSLKVIEVPDANEKLLNLKSLIISFNSLIAPDKFWDVVSRLALPTLSYNALPCYFFAFKNTEKPIVLPIVFLYFVFISIKSLY